MKAEKQPERGGIASQLRCMAIGAELEFDLAQHTTLCGTRQRLKKEPNMIGAHWSFLVDSLSQKVYVTRTK